MPERAAGYRPPYNGALEKNMEERNSETANKTFGRTKRDTRNNWVTLMFVCKHRRNCFRKQSHINTCTSALKEFEAHGFEFGTIGYGGSHVHFQVNVPKKYSIQTAEIMLKSRSSKRMFENHPDFRKLYPRGSFWSGYEHHESTGRIDFERSAEYIRNQQWHHGINIIDDTQQELSIFTAERDTSRPSVARA